MSLIIKNLSLRYDNNWIFKDVSLEAADGEILGLFGLSGEGKSTLLRAIAGIEKNCDGRVVFNDNDLTDIASKDRDFHFPTLTNESFWKTVFKTRSVSELADGEGQRMALDNALNNASNVLLLDNSFCQMDWLLRLENYQKLIGTVREKNLAVIFATNDYEEVIRVCDRAAVIINGEVRQTGTPREIYEHPNSPGVARVFGRNNLIEARRLTSSKAEVPEFQTIIGEHRIFTAKTEKRNLGALNQNVMLAIRPEHISISFGASFPEDNLLKATIRKVQFSGVTTQIFLDAGGLELEATVLRLVGLKIGDECMVGLPPDRILVLKD